MLIIVKIKLLSQETEINKVENRCTVYIYPWPHSVNPARERTKGRNQVLRDNQEDTIKSLGLGRREAIKSLDVVKGRQSRFSQSFG